MQRLQYIDRLKGFAMLSVVIGHIVCFCMYHNWDVASANPFLSAVNYYHMPLFMFLSGWVITELPSLHKLGRKLPRFLLPFGIIGTAYAFSLGQISWRWLMDDFKIGYWYLWVLAVYYILLMLVRPLFIGGGIVKFSIFAIIILILFRVLLMFLPSSVASLFSLPHIEAMWPYFIAGVIFRHCKKLDSLTDNNNFMTICWLFSFVLYLLFANVNMGHGIQVFSLALALSFFCLFRHFEADNSRVSNLLAFIGRHSLDVYVFHYFFFQIISLLPFGVWVSQTKNYLIEGMVIIPLAVIIALLSIGVGWLIRQSHVLARVIFDEKQII